MDRIEPHPHNIDIEPASTPTPKTKKRHSKPPKSNSAKSSGLGGFGGAFQRKANPKSAPQTSQSKQAKSKTWVSPQFKYKKLRQMYETGQGIHKYPEAVSENFFEKMQLLDMASNEQDIYNCRSLGFHKLEPKRNGKYAVGLTGNWRLTMTIEEDTENRYLLILEIVDYH
jgi:plasmid maintenance system killer protein